MLEAGAIASAMTSKTKASVLRDLVALAEKTGNLCDPKTLLASLEAREELCSTAVPGGFALPHPRSHDPYLFETSFIVVGRPVQEIHFGAPDGQPTHLFFLICCQDDRLHLHTLARLCLIVQKTKLLDQTPRRARRRNHAQFHHCGGTGNSGRPERCFIEIALGAALKLKALLSTTPEGRIFSAISADLTCPYPRWHVLK